MTTNGGPATLTPRTPARLSGVLDGNGRRVRTMA
jgi:hypothetical protein